MKIDYTMNGLNILLLCGVVILFTGICFLVMQNPFRNIKKFRAKDYILFGVILAMICAGIVCTVLGIINAIKMF